MFFSRHAGHRYVDRGDPSVADFNLADFVAEDIYYDLDMSSIVPAGAVSVVIGVYMLATLPGATVFFRTKGKTYTVEGNALRQKVVDQWCSANFLMACSNDRVIQGLRSNNSFTTLDIVVTGWFA